MDDMEISRRQAAAHALGSVRTGGLEPGPRVEAVLNRWARGELTDIQLAEHRQGVARGENIDDLLAHRQRRCAPREISIPRGGLSRPPA